MKRVLISGYFGKHNLGDELLLKHTIAFLQKTFPASAITAISHDPPATRRTHKIRAIHRFNLPGLVLAFLKGDYLFFIGGLFQDQTSFRSLLYYVVLGLGAHFWGCRIVLFFGGLGPLQTKLGIKLATKIIKLSFTGAIRDHEAYARSWPLPPALIASKDLLFAEEAASKPVFFKKNLKKVDSIKNSLKKGPLNKNKFKIGIVLKQNYPRRPQQKAVPHLLGQILKLNSPCPTCQLEFSFLGFKSPANDSLAREYPTLKIKTWGPSSQPLDIRGIYQAFACLDLLIAMNYHALLIAIQLGLPLIALAYDPKVDRLLHPVAPELILPLADFSLSACQKKATLVWQKKEHYNCQLVEYSKKCKINTQKSLEFIQEQLLKT